MRVLLVSQRFPPDDVGGVERYTQALAWELAKRGDQVSIVTRRPDPSRHEIELLRERLTEGSVVYRLVGGSVRFDRFLEHCEPLERLFTLAVLESGAEVVHINHLLGLSPRSVEIAHRLGTAVVISLHDFFFACGRVHLQKRDGGLCEGPDLGRECARTCFDDSSANGPVRWGLRTAYYRKIASCADAVITYSEFVAGYFRGFLPAGTNIHKIENGISITAASVGAEAGLESAPRPFTVAYCGMVAKHKGPQVILEALKIAALSNVTLLLIGDAPEQEYYKSLRETGDQIPGLKLQLYGRYERSELDFLLRDVDCVVVPSLVPEAGPIVPREALARGVPILVSKLGALPELVAEGENGFTFDVHRPAELAARLRMIADDRNLLRRLQSGALRSPVVTVAEHTGRIQAIYSDALEKQKSGRGARLDLPELELFHESLIALGCRDGKAHVSRGRHAVAGRS